MDCLFCLCSPKQSIVPNKTKTSSPIDVVRRSSSERFKHISPEVLKRLDPSGEVPIFNLECELSKAAYRARQNRVINRLMGFEKEEKL